MANTEATLKVSYCWNGLHQVTVRSIYGQLNGGTEALSSITNESKDNNLLLVCYIWIVKLNFLYSKHTNTLQHTSFDVISETLIKKMLKNTIL